MTYSFVIAQARLSSVDRAPRHRDRNEGSQTSSSCRIANIGSWHWAKRVRPWSNSPRFLVWYRYETRGSFRLRMWRSTAREASAAEASSLTSTRKSVWVCSRTLRSACVTYSTRFRVGMQTHPMAVLPGLRSSLPVGSPSARVAISVLSRWNGRQDRDVEHPLDVLDRPASRIHGIDCHRPAASLHQGQQDRHAHVVDLDRILRLARHLSRRGQPDLARPPRFADPRLLVLLVEQLVVGLGGLDVQLQPLEVRLLLGKLLQIDLPAPDALQQALLLPLQLRDLRVLRRQVLEEPFQLGVHLLQPGLELAGDLDTLRRLFAEEDALVPFLELTQRLPRALQLGVRLVHLLPDELPVPFGLLAARLGVVLDEHFGGGVGHRRRLFRIVRPELHLEEVGVLDRPQEDVGHHSVDGLVEGAGGLVPAELHHGPRGGRALDHVVLEPLPPSLPGTARGRFFFLVQGQEPDDSLGHGSALDDLDKRLDGRLHRHVRRRRQIQDLLLAGGRRRRQTHPLFGPDEHERDRFVLLRD